MFISDLFENDNDDLFAKPKYNSIAGVISRGHPSEIYYTARKLGFRLPAAEGALLKELNWAFSYVRELIKNSWPELEAAVLRVKGTPERKKLVDSLISYGKINDNTKQFVKSIAYTWKLPLFAAKFAGTFIRGQRSPEAEPIIIKDAEAAAHYALTNIRGRWPEAEPVIAKKARWAYEYAFTVLHSRWPEAEPVIARNAVAWSMYYRDCVRHGDSTWRGNNTPAGRYERDHARNAIISDQLLKDLLSEESDDMFAGRDSSVEVATAVEWVAGHWDQRAEQQNDPAWHTGADMLRKASLQFQRGGMMSGIRALNDVSEEWGWEVLGDDLEFYDEEAWQLIEPYLDHLDEDTDDGMFTDRKPLRDRLIDFLKEYSSDAESLASNEDEYEQYYLEEADAALEVADVFLKRGLLEGIHAFLKFNRTMSGNPGQIMEELTGITVADLIELESGMNEESDSDMFAPSKHTKAMQAIRQVLESGYEFYMQQYNDADTADDSIKARIGEFVGDFDFLLTELNSKGLKAFFNGLDAVDVNTIETIDSELALKHKLYLNDLEDQYNHLNENDDDLFANRTVVNPVSLARGIAQVAEEFEDRADRVSTWDAAESYRDDAAVLRVAARACGSGLRACMSELTAIEDPNSWDYLIEVLQQEFDIDLSSLYDQYERGELTESDDDLFADPRSSINLSKLTNSSLHMLFDAFRFETRPEYLPKVRRQMKKIAREFEQRGQPMPTAVLQQYDLTEDK